jgi:hypothetical protein
MMIDAHYYALLAFARASGFGRESAAKIAYASQFVDDAWINHIVLCNDPVTIEHDIIDGRPAFFNMATCHVYTQIKTLNYSSMVGNTCAFHFVPGCSGGTFEKKLRCKQDSPVISAMADKACNNGDLIKLGIVLHAYADTFSHQGFSGILSAVNDIRKCGPISDIAWDWSDRIMKTMRLFFHEKTDTYMDFTIPSYGHAQALDYPDLPYLVWSYEYDSSDDYSARLTPSDDIQNAERFTGAFQNIKKCLDEFLTRFPDHQDKSVQFDDWDLLYKTLIRKGTKEERIERWQNLLSDKGLFAKDDKALEYDKSAWLKQAFKNFSETVFAQRKVDGAVPADGFVESNWYKYYKAVRWYKDQFFSLCKDNGLDIPH